MAAVLTAATPAAERGAVLTVAVVDVDAPGVRVQLPSDVEVSGELVDEFGITHAATVVIADDDRTASLVADAELPAGAYLATVALESVTLDLAAEIRASTVATSAPFGAVLEDAAALVVKTPLTSSSNPSLGEARGYVADIAARVDLRLARRAALTSAADLETVEAAARGLVALGAAALIVDAMHPERATQQGERRYGDVLWSRFLEGLDELGTDLERRLVDGGTVAAGGRVAASFPPPSGIGRAGF